MDRRPTQSETLLSRRQFLYGAAGALGTAALGTLLGRDAHAAFGPHFAPRARRVIYMHMVGGTSHIDMFDPKPALARWDGKPCPAELMEG